MTRRTTWMIAIAALGLLATGAPAWAGEALHFGFDAEDMTKIDLAELADGETRVFGNDEKEITATRAGDDVTLTIRKDEDGDETTRELVCRVGRDSCFVIMGEGEEAPLMVMLKTTNVAGGEHEEEIDVLALSSGELGEGANVFIRKMAGDGPGHSAIWVGKEPGQVKVITGGGHGGAMLRCPEGDTTMHLDEEDEGRSFSCPKHGVPLEKLEGFGFHHVTKHVIIETEEEDE